MKRLPINLLNVFMAVFIMMACQNNPDGAEWAQTGITRAGTISHKQITEASGLAASRRQNDLLWVINDSGNEPVVYGVSSRGEYRGALAIQGTANVDWEDLASFEENGRPCLLIADVGDNSSKRKHCVLYIIEEPNMTASPSSISVKPLKTIVFTYEDGPRDCEAVSVEPGGNRAWLISKRDEPPVLYELALKKASADGGYIARRLGPLNSFEGSFVNQAAQTLFDLHVNRPTGFDISRDGLSAVILTYQNIYYFNRKKHENWLEALSSRPRVIPLPDLAQAESVCFSSDAKKIYVTSEKLPAPVLEIRVDTPPGVPN